MKNIYLKIAGVINLFTAMIHLVGGQIDLVNPLILSDLNTQQIGEWVGVWHIVTILLFVTSFILLSVGFKGFAVEQSGLLRFIGWLYILIALPSIGASIWFFIFAPQWVLLAPIGLLCLLGLRKFSSQVS